jgi:DNA-binding GntR family transcriptional regulator
VPLDLDDPRPAYEQLAAHLRAEIERGDYEPGDVLPSTAQLAESWQLAPMTVRRAFQVLQEEGRVVPRQGRGYFVRPKPAPRSPEVEPETPKTLDEALEIIRELSERLDRYEAGTPDSVPGSVPGFDPGPPPPEPDLGPDL